MILAEWQAAALQRLAAPPARDWIVRPTLRGHVVARFVLPLRLCPVGNVTGRAGMAANTKVLGRMKAQLADWMAVQHRPRRAPLEGRPQVLAVRFSSHEPDSGANFAKWPIDILCCRTEKLHNRLNFLHDDRPRLVEVHQWWEPIGRGQGFVFLEVRADAAASR